MDTNKYLLKIIFHRNELCKDQSAWVGKKPWISPQWVGNRMRYTSGCKELRVCRLLHRKFTVKFLELFNTRSKVLPFQVWPQMFTSTIDSDSQGGIRKPLSSCCFSSLFSLEDPRKFCQSRWCKSELIQKYSIPSGTAPRNAFGKLASGGTWERASYIEVSKNP